LLMSASYPPDAYGIRYDHITPADLTREPAPGLYVVSAHFVARIPALPASSDWLHRIQPIAIVGHSLYVYDIPQTP
jgi:hypothetical protein